jgi:hypothetical protein
VADAINDGTTDIAPSQNAVHDALVLKVNVTDKNKSVTNDNSGAITVGQFVYMKANGNVDLAKADASATSTSKIGIVYDASIAAAGLGAVTFQKGSFITGLTGLTPGQPVYLSTGTAGGYTQTIPTAVGQIILELGEALSASVMEFAPKKPILIAS